MSNSDAHLDGAAEVLEHAAEDIAGGKGQIPPLEQVQRAIAAAIRLYGAYAQSTGDTVSPAGPEVSSTDAVVLATALLKARDLNPFDLALWFNRAS